jgi:hypothetical protein
VPLATKLTTILCLKAFGASLHSELKTILQFNIY